MSRKTSAEIKPFFQTGDIPTQQEFYDWIESCFMQNNVAIANRTGAGAYEFLTTLPFTLNSLVENPFFVKFDVTNTNAGVTLTNLDTLFSAPLLKSNGDALAVGDLKPDTWYWVILDGSGLSYNFIGGIDAGVIPNLQQVLQSGAVSLETVGTSTLEIYMDIANDFYVSYTDTGTATLSDLSVNATSAQMTTGNTGLGGTNTAIGTQAAQLDLTLFSGFTFKALQFSPTEIKFTDTINLKGVVYASDYSANFIARSLIDKGFVDNTFLALAGGTMTGDIDLDSNMITNGTGSITLTPNAMAHGSAGGNLLGLNSNNLIVNFFNNTSGFSGLLDGSGVTGSVKTWTLQNETGTLSLTSENANISEIITPPTLTATANNYNPTGFATATMLRVDVNANNREISDLQAPPVTVPPTPRVVSISNLSTTNDIRFLHNDALSTAENRFLLRDNNQKSIKPNETAQFWYDSTNERWKPLNRVG